MTSIKGNDGSTVCAAETALVEMSLSVFWKLLTKHWALSLIVILCVVLMAGCGSGGYPGGGISALSPSSITLDAGQAFDFTTQVSGRATPAWSLSGPTCSGSTCGTLSNATGTSITYTAPPTVSGITTITLTSSVPGTQSALTATITVNRPPTISGNPPSGTIGVPYTTTLTAAGGSAPLRLSLLSGSLPAGLSFNTSTGVISGTPTAVGVSNFAVQVIDSSNVPYTVTATELIPIAAAGAGLMTVSGNPSNGTVGISYSSALHASGGTSPYTWSVVGGALPAGLSLSAATGIISGIPTVAGTSNFTAQARDAAGATASGAFSVTIAATRMPLLLTLSSLPNGTVKIPYSNAIGISGGTAPYACSITSGTLQAGLTLNGCTVTGTPTATGTANLTVKVTDSSSPSGTTSGPVSLTIVPGPLAIAPGALPNGTVGVPYSSAIGVSGGTAPYSCAITDGALQAGLTLTGCTVSGTPTAAGTANLTVKATDASGAAASGPVALTIAAPLAISTGTLPNGTVNVPYSSAIGVSGSTAPYACSISSGTLQAGLTLNGCTVSGLPSASGTANLTVNATDANGTTTTGPVSLTIVPAPLAITVTSLPNGSVGLPYNNTIGVSGGTAPYSCAITSGARQAGLSLNGCTVSGTPTVAGTVTLGVRATDAAGATTNGPVSLTITPAGGLSITSPPTATVSTPYSGTIGTTGGTAPYTCMLTGGTLPAGLTSSGCVISGTPTVPGSSTVTVKVTDSSNPSVTSMGPVTVTVAPATSLSLSSPPAATVATPYTGAIGVAGGTGPYTCQLLGGTIPAGLTLTNCTLTGTPTTAGSTTLNIKATDSANPTATTTTGPVVVTVNPIEPVTLTGLAPNGVVGQPYTQTLHTAGGVAPYTYAITAGALPVGLNLSPGGVISGTPTTVGASSFTVTATDSQATPQSASLSLVLLVTYAPTANDAGLKGPYAFLFQGYDDTTVGLLAYQTAMVGSFTADGLGGISAGELDSNHQSSNPTGTTISSSPFLGTYQVGADNRGTLTITTLNTDGTTAATSTYAIALKAPAAPATASTQGSLIEFDNNSVQGTKGSGSLLAQTTTAFATGLSGSYAFGMQGDTPCLPACTIGVIAGPAASVGQFTTGTAGALTGTSDANISSTNYASEALAGNVGTADGNGRLQMTMTTANTPVGVYPTDYAVYIVDANRALILSTDKHSSYILLAGSAQLQTQATFSNASLTGAFVGYENSPTNPGLVGTTVQNTANLSTATIIRGTADAAGTCTITNVDVGGSTGLVNGTSGLGSGSANLNAALGTYQSTGPAGCTATANGRGVINYPVPNPTLTATLIQLGLSTAPPPPRTVYLFSPNGGYFLETGYAGLGKIEPQTGAPFSLATFNGTFVYGSTPASSVASTNTSGVITADGAGQATSTVDMNVGVGTVNVLAPNMTTTSTYTLTDATAGRFLLGSYTVIYAISPNRFVLLDTSPSTTSPSISLLY